MVCLHSFSKHLTNFMLHVSNISTSGDILSRKYCTFALLNILSSAREIHYIK